MNFDSTWFGPQGITSEDGQGAGCLYSEVRKALFANAYYLSWGAPGELPMPVYGVTLRRALSGLSSMRKGWRFLQAAERSVQSHADLRWGDDGRGFRRILHPNGVCLLGTWKIDDVPVGKHYSG